MNRGLDQARLAKERETLRRADVCLAGVVAEALVLQLAYSNRSAGRLDSSAPAHLPTFAITDLLNQLGGDVDQQEEAWEAIRTYADMRAAGALSSLIPLLRGAALEAARQQDDASLLRAIDRCRIELLPEYEAGFTARAYGAQEQPIAQVVAMTAREALANLVHQLQPAEPEAGA